MKLFRATCVAAALILSNTALAETAIVVQSTTSTANSGLYEHLLPRFEEDHAIKVNVVAVGTGQAIKNASNCDGDVLLVHAKSAEEAFVTAGHGLRRDDLMYNDFVIVGPTYDPAGIKGLRDAEAALTAISAQNAAFASRGDDSGTHKKEMSLWGTTGVDPTVASGTWYRETGSGMGATLNVAVGMSAYVMTDRATWLSFGNKADFDVMVEGDQDLFNQYGIIPGHPDHCPNVNAEAAQTFVDWMLSDTGQEAIGSYTIDGAHLFFPNAGQ